jgi:hypothetical protein
MHVTLTYGAIENWVLTVLCPLFPGLPQVEVFMTTLAYLLTAPKYPFTLSSVYPTDNPIMSRSPPRQVPGEPSSRGTKRNVDDALDKTDPAVPGTHSPEEQSFAPDGLTAKETASRTVKKRSRAGCLTCRKRRVGIRYLTLFAPLMIGEMRRETSYLRWMRGTSGSL